MSLTKLDEYLGNRSDIALLVLRVVIGIVFFAHGLGKFQMGVENVAGFFGSVGIPAAYLAAWVVTIVETFGGLALILGLGTRWAALPMSVVMIVAIITVKLQIGLIAPPEGGIGYELDMTLLAGLVALLLQGAGPYSVDAQFFQPRSSNPAGVNLPR